MSKKKGAEAGPTKEELIGQSTSADFVQVYLINVEIRKGIDLEKADILGKSDPYCKVSAFGRHYQTKTIMKTLNPVWNEKTQLTYFDNPKKLRFEVWDWDKNTKSDAIGEYELDISNFFEAGSKGFDGRLKLIKCKKGEIDVCVTGMKLVPSEMENKIGTLQKQIAVEKNLLAGQNEEISKITNENKGLEKKNGEIRVKNANLEDEIEKLQNQLENLKKEETKLNEDISKNESKKTSLSEECETVEKAANEVRQDLNKLQKTNDSLKDECDDLQSQLSNLKKQWEEQKEEQAMKEAAAKAAEEKPHSPILGNKGKESYQQGLPSDDIPLTDTKTAKGGENTKCGCQIL